MVKFITKHEKVDDYDVLVVRNSSRSPETVVMIHGIGVSHAYFKPFMKAMAPWCQVYALDLPGYGTARDPEEVLSIEQLSGIVNAFIKQHRLKNVTIIGHSMGSQIVVQSVLKDMKLYKKCILLAPTIHKHERTLPMQAWHLVQDSVREPLKLNYIIMRDYWRMGPGRYLKTSRSMIEDAIEKEIVRVRLPVLIVNGTNDPIVPNDWAETLARVAPNGRKIDIRGPHNFHFSHAKELSQKCRQFIVG